MSQLIKDIIEKDSADAYHQLYTKIIKRLAINEGLPVGYFDKFFDYCKSQDKIKSQKYLDKVFRKRIQTSYKDKGEWICSRCGAKKKLTIHHIYKKADYPHLRYDKNNIGILCEKCHQKLHMMEDKMITTNQIKKKMLIPFEDTINFKISHVLQFPYSSLEKILRGDKMQETICIDVDFNPGEIIEAQFIQDKDIVDKKYLVVISMDTKKFNDLNVNDSLGEGLGSFNEYQQGIQEKYPEINTDTVLKLVLFTCIKEN